jgi:threonine aldolase
MMSSLRGFGSDNNSGVHPDILEAISSVNLGHVPGYGDDIYTREAMVKFREIFGEESEVFFVFGGTAANILGLAAAVDSFNAVICARTAHINVDECGAPEKFTGCKLIDLPTPDGKLTTDLILPHLHGAGDVHSVQVKVISITQPSEIGTLYTEGEVRALADFAHQRGMLLHMDGARIANAAAALDLPLRAITRDAGVDILSFGGTKNGMMYGEAVIVFRKGLALKLPYLRKQAAQLASKMRFIAAQFSALLSNDLWLRNARQANAMAKLLAQEAARVPGVRLAQRTQANAVFAVVDKEILARLQENYFFYLMDKNGWARWMTSFDTTEEDVHAFVACMRG